MPSWKKVITSGSTADLNIISASAFHLAGSGTGELEVEGNITASGNISASNLITNNITASGNISGSSISQLHMGGNSVFYGQLAVNNTLSANGHVNLGNAAADQITIAGHITASGNISASGDTHKFGGDITASGNIIGGGNLELTASAQAIQPIIHLRNDKNHAAAQPTIYFSSGSLPTNFNGADVASIRFVPTTGKTLSISNNIVDGKTQFAISSSTHIPLTIEHSGIDVTGDITASGEISGSTAAIAGQAVIGGHLIANGYVTLGNNTADRIVVNGPMTASIISGSDILTVGASITSSADISASGEFIGSSANITNITSSVISASGAITASGIEISGSGTAVFEVLGNVSSSAAGTGSFGHLMVGGGNFTSASLAAGGSSVSDADTTTKGIVELATTAETTTGTDATRAVTPDGLKDGYQGSTNVVTVGALNAGSITSGFTSIDVGSGAITTTGTATLGTTLTTVNKFEKTGTTDAEAQGDVVYFGGTTSMDAGKLYHYKSDGTWELANSDAVATSDGLLAVALGAASDTNGMLLRGMVTLDHDPGAVGDVLYISGSGGIINSTKPAESGDCVRVVGYCLDASNGQIWFNPSSTFVEVA